MQLPSVYDVAITILIPLVVLAVTFLAVRLYQTIIRGFRGRIPAGLLASFQQFGSWVIWMLGIIVALSMLSVNIQILLLIIGLGGAAVVLAYRDVLTEIVSSQFISTYQPVKVGEWVEVQNHYGRVIETDLIETKLLTPNNEIVVIPNSVLMKEPLVNKTRSGVLRVQIPVYVRRGLDVGEVEDRLLELAGGMKVDLAPDSNPEVRMVELTQDHAQLELLLEIANPAKRDLITSDVQKMVYGLMQKLERQLLIRADK